MELISNRPVPPSYLKEVLHDQHVATISQMPYVWTSIDTRNVAIASVIPIGLGLTEYIQSRPGGNYHKLYESLVKPSWLKYPPHYFGMIDAITTIPLGYASYLIYKNGQGIQYTDTSVALGLYGVNLFFVVLNIILFEKRNLKALSLNKILNFISSTATAIAFYKVDQKAGFIYSVYSVIAGGAAFAYYQLCKMNSSKDD